MLSPKILAWLALPSIALASVLPQALSSRALPITSCPGYVATNVTTTSTTLTANLNLAGPACNTYGTDLDNLLLLVEYQTATRLHVKVYDAAENVYQVPVSVLPRPATYQASSLGPQNALTFNVVANPFSFSVTRKSNGEVLFNTSGSPMIFQSQYLKLRTQLPANPNLYGLGEHTDPFRLNTTNYTRTLWSRDAYEIPTGTNLYGNHPVYFDHRGSLGTHGVFLLNSNGMDIKINDTASAGQYLEYNTLGGVFDFYFLAGPSPKQVAEQYADTVGHSALMPYWGLGFHQCRYGMQDVYEVAGVVANYSSANIPLETMWTDIDYMDHRKVFTLDPLRFPLNLMQELVHTLHSRQQHYIVMVDPSVAYQDYAPFNNGVADDAFLVLANGSVYKGVTWPGVSVWPDWFAPNTQNYWDNEFLTFFDPTTGVDIDALWIDLNEASNFCPYPCNDPEGFALSNDDPPIPPAVRLGSPYAIPGFPADFQPQCVAMVHFEVYATTYYGENIIVIGNTSTLGDGAVDNGAPLSPDTYPTWEAIIDLPVNTTISYQYVRMESDGSYIYELINRTVATGTCDGSVTVVSDTITTTSNTPACNGEVVEFEVTAYTYYGENIYILGNVTALGSDVVTGALALSPNTYPVWEGTFDLPLNSVVAYQYVRLEADGSYIYENINRTITTGATSNCGGTTVVQSDTITSVSGPSKMRRRESAAIEPLPLPKVKRQTTSGSMLGLPGRNLTYPPYTINNAAGSLSDLTLNTDLVHANGLVEYDTHNMFGTMMSAASRNAMLNRRPTLRPMVITRSTFAGAGRQVGHWLGDNVSDWPHYRISIAEMLEFAAMFQIPMVGSDVCGYAGNTDQWLCARWAQLGAFYPFYRNHDANDQLDQEFYRWPLVTEAAQIAIDARYRLLDYLYTAFYTQNQTGNPLLNPLFFMYPSDANTFGIQLQYFFGDSILVSPVTDDNATEVTLYLPNDQFYDFFTYEPVRGAGADVYLPDVPFTAIPVHIKGGAVLPLRASSANTTTMLRQQPFNLVVAPGLDGTATGTLYLDDGVSIAQPAVSVIAFTYTAGGLLTSSGSFGYNPGVLISTVTLLGASATMAGGTPPAGFSGHTGGATYNGTSQTLTFAVGAPLTKAISVQLGGAGFYGTW